MRMATKPSAFLKLMLENIESMIYYKKLVATLIRVKCHKMENGSDWISENEKNRKTE